MNILPPSTADDAPAATLGTDNGGDAPPVGERSYGGVMEWPDVPKSASRRGLGAGPPPVDPAMPMGTRIDLVNPSADEVSGGTRTGISSSSIMPRMYYCILIDTCLALPWSSLLYVASFVISSSFLVLVFSGVPLAPPAVRRPPRQRLQLSLQEPVLAVPRPPPRQRAW